MSGTPDPTDAGDVDVRDLQRLLAGATSAQEALDAWLPDVGPCDPATPTALPGWTVGHVLTHLARNAESHLRMLAGEPQYPGGRAQRDGEISEGAGRSWAELLDDLAVTQRALAAAWASQTEWGFVADRGAGPRPAALLPFYRWREVEVHRADLGLGYGFADMPGEYLRRELARMEMAWRASRPMGLTQLPAEALAVPVPQRVAWLLGRGEIDGLGPAGVF